MSRAVLVTFLPNTTITRRIINTSASPNQTPFYHHKSWKSSITRAIKHDHVGLGISQGVIHCPMGSVRELYLSSSYTAQCLILHLRRIYVTIQVTYISRGGYRGRWEVWESSVAANTEYPPQFWALPCQLYVPVCQDHSCLPHSFHQPHFTPIVPNMSVRPVKQHWWTYCL